MKKHFLFLMIFLSWNIFANGQQKEEAEKLVNEGVRCHDKGDYTGAIAMYDKALQLDQHNLYALAEKAMSLLPLQKHAEAIQVCQIAIEKHPGERALMSVYVTYGTAYDGLKNPNKSIEVYNEGIQLFPDFFLLHFNKGITLTGMEEYEEAILCFQSAVTFNPEHGSSHNALGLLLDLTGKRIPSLLATCRFLVIEPEGQRARSNMGRLQKLMQGNVEKTGKNSITIGIDPKSLGDTTAAGKPNENNFSTIDLLLSMLEAMDYSGKKKKRNKNEIDQFANKFESIS